MNVSRHFRNLLVLMTLVAVPLAAATTFAAPPQRAKQVQQVVLAIPAQGAAPAGGAKNLAGAPTINCDLAELAENLKAKFHDKCTGYQIAIFHDGKLYQEIHGGVARNSADSPARSISASDRLEMGSVSKTLNAIATIKVLSLKGKTVDEPISPYLPQGWSKHASISGLKFRHLLSHTSGLEEFSTIDPQDYTPGKINQGIKNVLAKGVVHPQTSNYNNMNYELLRVLVPYLVDSASMKAVEGNEKAHEKTLANCFAGLVRQHVFSPAGVGTKVYLNDYHPSGDDYKFARYYDYSKKSNAGVAAEDRSLRPGRGGWKMTAKDLAQVAAALEAGYLVSPGQLQSMKDGKLGLFSKDTVLGRYYGHNGKSHAGSAAGLGQICMFPGNVQVALLINSAGNSFEDSTGDNIRDAWLDACQSPDLIVTSFAATGGAKFEDGKLKVPFSMTVKNQGKAATKNNFVNAVRYNQDFRWSGIMDPLAAGASKTVSGFVAISDPTKSLAGKSIKVVAYCDAPIAAADTSIPSYGRVKESNEPNNLTKFIDVQVPAAVGSLAVENVGKGKSQKVDPKEKVTPVNQPVRLKRLALPK